MQQTIRGPEILIPQTPAAFALARAEALKALASRRKDRKRAWYRVENNIEGESADLYIYDEIVSQEEADFCGVGVSAQGFLNELQALRSQVINLYIKSPGGLVFDGIAIYNALLRHDAPVNVIVDGIAASIASVIAMAGDTVTMSPGSMLMMHEPFGMTVGNKADHEQMAAILDKQGESIAGVYARRADKKINWRQQMLDETWFTAEEAVQVGLADQIDERRAVTSNEFDLSNYRNVPVALGGGSRQAAYLVMNLLTSERRTLGMDDKAVDDAVEAPIPHEIEPENELTVRDAEHVLREAGFSARRAKAILATGWSTSVRDEPVEPAAAATETVDEADIPDRQALYRSYQKTLAMLNGVAVAV